ncbi:MAG: hypothetical protein JWQ06_2447 [Mucilaginibacter sp.]|nr:hypothetical protein [Mucilaginibacter sp.]
MEEKKRIDIKRDSGGTVNVGTTEDGGIVECSNSMGR